MATGIVWLLDSVGLLDLRLRTLIPVALVAVGLGIASAGWRGRLDTGLVTVAVVLSLVGVGSAQIRAAVPPTSTASQLIEAPTSPAGLRPLYEVGVGSLVLDLSRLRLDRPRRVRIDVGIGKVSIRLPEDVPARVDARVGVGQTRMGVEERQGFGIEAGRTFGPGEPTLTIRVDVGIGSVEVDR